MTEESQSFHDWLMATVAKLEAMELEDEQKNAG